MSIDGGILVVDDADHIRRLNYEISKIGNNINQITRVANLTKSVSQNQIDQVKEMMLVIWQYQKDISTLFTKVLQPFLKVHLQDGALSRTLSSAILSILQVIKKAK